MTFTVKSFLILFAGKPDFFSGNLRTISYFDFYTLRKATKNFYEGNLLGRGGFGPVYQVLQIYANFSVKIIFHMQLRFQNED